MRYWGAIGCLVQGERARPALELLVKALKDRSPSVQVAAAQALAGLGRVNVALPALTKALQSENEWVKVQALNVVDDLGPKAASLRAAVDELKADKGEYIKRLVEHSPAREINLPSAPVREGLSSR